MKFKCPVVLAVLPIILVGLRCSEAAEDSSVLSKIPSRQNDPATAEKIAFGKQLFFDKRLSHNNQISCASCHRPDKAFTDGLPKSIGVNGRVAMRNAPSLLNSAYSQAYMYDAEVKTLEMQALVPIQDHLEMASSMKEVLEKLRKDSDYRQLAKSVFNRELDAFVITRALSAYERSLISRNSRFDHYRSGRKDALTKNELAGWKLFSEKLYCTQCHSGPDFTNYRAMSNGLYADYGADEGRYRINGLETERGTFKVPGLRNVSLTAPYMHDGSMQTLREVILHYSKGGKPFPNKSARIKPFVLTDLEISQLESFLHTLVDTSGVR